MLGTIEIPIRTLWKRGDPISLDKVPANVHKGTLKLTVGDESIPYSSLFGEGDYVEFDESLTVCGQTFILKKVKKNADGHSFGVYIEVLRASTENPIPLIPLLIVAVTVLGAGFFIWQSLSKVEGIVEVPAVGILAGLGLLMFFKVR